MKTYISSIRKLWRYSFTHRLNVPVGEQGSSLQEMHTDPALCVQAGRPALVQAAPKQHPEGNIPVYHCCQV